MDLAEYQAEAAKTDQVPGDEQTAIMIPLLGLAGEVGELLTEFKKHQRDGEAHRFFTERAAEELGDLLWYAANLATKFGLELDKIAADNIAKCQDRWAWRSASGLHDVAFDNDYPEGERLPRIVKLEVTDVEEGGVTTMRAFVDGKPVGSPLTDNAYSSDGYRFHDVFHLAFASCLGWSPVMRKVLDRKRKSNSATDEIEDGGRATASLFVTKGRLYIFESVVPGGGDIESPAPGRFVQTVIFNIDWDWSVWPPVPR